MSPARWKRKLATARLERWQASVRSPPFAEKPPAFQVAVRRRRSLKAPTNDQCDDYLPKAYFYPPLEEIVGNS